MSALGSVCIRTVLNLLVLAVAVPMPAEASDCVEWQLHAKAAAGTASVRYRDAFTFDNKVAAYKQRTRNSKNFARAYGHNYYIDCGPGTYAEGICDKTKVKGTIAGGANAKGVHCSDFCAGTVGAGDPLRDCATAVALMASASPPVYEEDSEEAGVSGIITVTNDVLDLAIDTESRLVVTPPVALAPVERPAAILRATIIEDATGAVLESGVLELAVVQGSPFKVILLKSGLLNSNAFQVVPSGGSYVVELAAGLESTFDGRLLTGSHLEFETESVPRSQSEGDFSCPEQALFISNLDLTNGPLAGREGWAAHSAAGVRPVEVLGEAIRLQQASGSGEDVHRRFALQSTTAKTFAGFTLKVPSGPVIASNDYFAHFRAFPDTLTFRARVHVGPPSDGTHYSLGISAADAASTPVVMWPTQLECGRTYEIAIMYDAAMGTAQLWVDPQEETDPSITSGPAAAAVGARVESFALRQASGTTSLQLIDKVAVGPSLCAVRGVVAAVPSNTPVGLLLVGAFMLALAATVLRRPARV